MSEILFMEVLGFILGQISGNILQTFFETILSKVT